MNVEAEVEAMETEAVVLKCNHFRFHSDQGFPTKEKLHSYDFVLNVTEVKVFVNASNSSEYSSLDCVAFPAALFIISNLRSELRALFRTEALLL